MLTFFRIIIWVIFLLLCVYVYLSSTKNDFDDKYTYSIRKFWYLIYILGSLVMLTNNPETLFTHWERYLIALVVFIVIDSLLFLNLYVSKLGGQELQKTKKQIGVTQEKYDEAIQKSNNIPKTLHSFDFPMYNSNEEEYIYHLERLLKVYGDSENLIIDLIPYRNSNEQEELLEVMGKLKDKVKRILKYEKAFISSKDNLALYQFNILEESYIVQVQTEKDEDIIMEIDGNAITTMVIAYTLTVDIETKESGEVYDNN